MPQPGAAASVLHHAQIAAGYGSVPSAIMVCSATKLETRRFWLGAKVLGMRSGVYLENTGYVVMRKELDNNANIVKAPGLKIN
jgi:hypothetical protein